MTGSDGKGQTLKKGDVVLIEDGTYREYWPLARIEEVFEGRDKKIRSVMFNVRGKLLKRGISQMYLLESSCSLLL